MPQDYYSTSDLVIAAYLRTKGHSVTIMPTETRFASIKFPAIAATDAEECLRGNTLAEPYELMNARRDILRRITAARREGGAR